MVSRRDFLKLGSALLAGGVVAGVPRNIEDTVENSTRYQG